MEANISLKDFSHSLNDCQVGVRKWLLVTSVTHHFSCRCWFRSVSRPFFIFSFYLDFCCCISLIHMECVYCALLCGKSTIFNKFTCFCIAFKSFVFLLCVWIRCFSSGQQKRWKHFSRSRAPSYSSVNIITIKHCLFVQFDGFYLPVVPLFRIRIA